MKPTSPLQGIIFDVDGTVLDSQPVQYEWFKHAAAHFEGTKPFPPNDDEFKRGYNEAYDTSRLLGIYKFAGIDFEKHSKAIWPAYIAFNREHPAPVFPGVEAAIREIHRRSRITRERKTALRLAMNTTKTWASLSPTLQSVIHLFDTIVTKDDVYDYCTDGAARAANIPFDDYQTLRGLIPEELIQHLEKPNSLSAWLTIERLGTEPNAVIAVEDTAVGIKSYKSILTPKRRADIHVAGVGWGYQTAAELTEAGADTILTKPEELVTLVGDYGGLD